ncbi:hypothetical protein V6N11_073130 [Hibiscus sabdariffa]|uniref:Uncharacterized protein n=1 Tax=Hibiscus sabdariffa TaxID=183260 RepID=A0ABR2P958_9ROSI
MAGALAPLFAPARNALDAALALSRLGLPRCFHWLFHSLGKPLVAPSEVALPRFSSMPGLLLRCRCIVCRPLWHWASVILGGYPPRYASPDLVWRPIHGTCSLLLLPCTTGALAPLFAPARNALDAALDLSRLGLPRCFHWLFHSLSKPLVAPSWLHLCAAAKVPVSSAGRSPRLGPSVACSSLGGLACKSPLGRPLWAVVLCRKPLPFGLFPHRGNV